MSIFFIIFFPFILLHLSKLDVRNRIYSKIVELELKDVKRTRALGTTLLEEFFNINCIKIMKFKKNFNL